MHKRNFKGRCQKRMVPKGKEVCRTYDDIGFCYLDILSKKTKVKEIRCNVTLDDTEYTSDFVCTKADGDFMVRECVKKDMLTKPMTVKMLDLSRNYWISRGVSDWGIVVDE